MVLKAMEPGLKDLDAKTLEIVVEGLKQADDNLIPYSEILKTDFNCISKTAEYAMRSRSNLQTLINLYKDSGLYTSGDVSNIKINARWLYVCLIKGRIRNNLRRYTERALELAGAPLTEGEEQELEALIGKDPISRMLLPVSASIVDKTQYALIKTELRGTRLRAAVELYQRSHNQLPANLDVLVADGIIKEIPVDPFSNESFKYVDNKIYSIGPDFEDDGGDVNIKWRISKNKGDIIFQIGEDLKPGLNKPAPQLSAKEWINSQPLTLSGLKGKVVLLKFWSITSRPSREDMLRLEKTYQKYKDRGLMVIAIHWGTSAAEEVKKFVRENKITFAVAIDKGEDWRSATFKTYGIDRFSQKWLIDKEGKIRYIGWKSLQNRIETLLTE